MAETGLGADEGVDGMHAREGGVRSVVACRQFHQRFTRVFLYKILKKQKYFSLVTFLAKKALSYEKRARKMLMKLTPSDNFINVKRANFLYEF